MHRIRRKPVTRRVWAPRGDRPTALGHHRYEWLYVTAFVAPATGESPWYVGSGVSKPPFEALLAAFDREAGAGRARTIILLLDGAGWHTEPGLAIPEGLRLVYLPPNTTELQPAECLWQLVTSPSSTSTSSIWPRSNTASSSAAAISKPVQANCAQPPASIGARKNPPDRANQPETI